MPNDRVKAILFEALERPSGERTVYIDRACENDEALREDVLRLLASHEQAGEFLGEPSIDTGSKAIVKPEEQLPVEIGGRKILGKLGEGGFGVVYLAQQESPVRMLVAVKVVRPGMGSQQVLARFETERRALELMKHPNIASVTDAGTTDDGLPYFVMEHVPGEPITAYVNRKQPDVRTRLELFEQVCFAVQHAHQKGVIHRDLKPSNVLVTEIDGKPTPKVIDFGIAKAVRGPLSDRTVITQSAQIVGTPQYMSPEQVSFGAIDVDTRSDVYSLGALLYEILTGAPPYDTERLNKAGAAELERIIREENPPKPSTRMLKRTGQSEQSTRLARALKGDLDWIVARAMEKDRSRRYPTPAALGADCRRYLEGDAVEAGPPSGFYRLRKLMNRHKPEFIAAAVVLLALVAVVVVSLVFAARAERSKHNAEVELAKFQSISRFTEQMLSGIDPAVARGADTALFRSVLDGAAERVGEQGIGEPEVEIELRTMIGQAYRSVALFDESEAQLRRAVEIANETLGAVAPLTLDVESAYAHVLGETSRQEEALAIFASVHERRAATLGIDDPMTLEANSNVGAVLNQLGRYQESYDVQVDVLERRLRVLGDEHEDTMATRNNIANVLDELNRDEEAIALLERVVEFQSKTDGEDHPRTLSTMNNLAYVLDGVGRWQEAEAMYRRVLAVKQRVLPEGHPSTIITMNNLASLLGSHGEPERAVVILNEAIVLCVGTSGDHDIKTLTLRNNLASNLMRLERKGEAIDTMRLVVEGLDTINGPTDPRSIGAKAQLAQALVGEGRGEEALVIAAGNLRYAMENLPPEHRLLATAHLAYGKSLNIVGRTDEGDDELRTAHGIALATFGEADPRMVDYLKPLQERALAKGQLAESDRLLAEIADLEAPAGDPGENN